MKPHQHWYFSLTEARIPCTFGLWCLLWWCTASALAQQQPVPTQPSPSSSRTSQPASQQRTDSAATPMFKPLQELAPTEATASKGEKLTKSPELAAALSLVAGAGQVYIGSYWKAGLFFGGWAFCAWQTYTYHTQFLLYSQQYDALDSASRLTNLRPLRLREVYHDLRDTFFFITIGVSLFAAIDAYTGAHLYDFDVTDDLKASLYLTPTRVTLAVRW